MKTSVAHLEKHALDTNTDVFFPEGIVGFTEHKEYKIVPEKSKAPFLWLQSVDNLELSFIIIDPQEFNPDYNPLLSEVDKTALEVNDTEECQFYTIVVVPKDSDKISANLLAPLVINKKISIGKQVILKDQNYSVQHLILEEMLKRSGEKDVSSFAQTK